MGCSTAFCDKMTHSSRVLEIQSSRDISNLALPFFFASWKLSFRCFRVLMLWLSIVVQFTKKLICFEFWSIFRYDWVMNLAKKFLSKCANLEIYEPYKERSNFVFCSVWKLLNFNSDWIRTRDLARRSRSPYPIYQIALWIFFQNF